jgi:type I restriction enzyme S subunit
MEDIGIDRKFFEPRHAKPLGEVAGSYTYFADGDVLLAKITPCFENGKLGIAANLTNGIGFGSSEYIVFRPNEALDKEWLYYFLSRESFRIEGAQRMTGAVGHKRVAKEFIDEYSIPLPSLPEQQRIVAILDEAFAGIATAKANAEKNLQNAREVFENYLHRIFTQRGEGWVEVTLGDVCNATQGIQISKSEQSSTKRPNYRRYLYISDFDHDKRLKYVADIYPSKVVTNEDIVVANTGSAGRIFRGMDGVLSNNLFKVSFRHDAVDRDFLFYFVTSSLFQNYQHGIMRGTANPHMGHVNFKSTPLCLPGVDKQKHLVSKLDALNEETQHLTSIYQRKLAALDELKKSLLHKAFNGEL